MLTPAIPGSTAVRQDIARRTRRIAETEACLHAYREVFDEPLHLPSPSARTLDGLVVGVKELARRGSDGGFDAPLVQRMLDHGAYVIGTHRAHGLGLGVDDPGTRHPWLTDYYPGGSTAGGGVAVATGTCDVAVGTDTGGSIRKPAAMCGIVGFKPTHGLLPMDGLQPLTTSADHAGLLARDVATIRRCLDALAAPDPVAGNGAGARRQRRLVVIAESLRRIDQEVARTFSAAIALLRQCGYRVDEVSVPGFDRLVDVHATITGYEFAESVTDDALAGQAPEVVAAMTANAGISHDEYVYAAKAARPVVDRIHKVAEDAVLMTPTTAIGPLPMKAFSPPLHLPRYCRNTAPFNLTGQPAISIPASARTHGIPVGLQLVGASGQDDALLRTAEAVAATLRSAGGSAPQANPNRRVGSAAPARNPVVPAERISDDEDQYRFGDIDCRTRFRPAAAPEHIRPGRLTRVLRLLHLRNRRIPGLPQAVLPSR